MPSLILVSSFEGLTWKTCLKATWNMSRKIWEKTRKKKVIQNFFYLNSMYWRPIKHQVILFLGKPCEKKWCNKLVDGLVLLRKIQLLCLSWNCSFGHRLYVSSVIKLSCWCKFPSLIHDWKYENQVGTCISVVMET